MLAQRTTLFGTSGTASARAAAAAAAASGKTIIDLTAGEIWADLSPDVRAGAIAAITKGINRYTDTIGLLELREALAETLARQTGQPWKADEVAVTTGAKQALFNAAMVLLNPGDEVIIPAPYWTTFPAQVLIAGGTPVFVEAPRDTYLPRVGDIEAALSPRTRAIILNTPGNPTGAIYDAETLAGIARLAARRDLWVIFDECYGAFAHAPSTHQHILAVAPELRERTLIVNAFSKTLALTGWRIGYLAGPKHVISAVKALQSHTTSNPNVIAQHAVLAHLKNGDGEYEQTLSEQLRVARRQGLAILAELRRVPVPAAQGGFYFYLDISALHSTADNVVNTLLAEAGVAGVSGSAFGDPNGIRLSYGIPVAQLEGGLRRVVKLLNAWN